MFKTAFRVLSKHVKRLKVNLNDNYNYALAA